MGLKGDLVGNKGVGAYHRFSGMVPMSELELWVSSHWGECTSIVDLLALSGYLFDWSNACVLGSDQHRVLDFLSELAHKKAYLAIKDYGRLN